MQTSSADDALPPVEALRKFVARNLAEDLASAQGAGHGFGHLPLGTLEQDDTTPGWTRLDLTDNVRPTRDVTYLRRFAPRQVQARTAALLQVVAIADEPTLLLLAQPYKAIAWARHLGWRDEWELPTLTGVQVADLRDGLLGG